MPPQVICLLVCDPGHAGVVQSRRHLGADEVYRCDERGIEVGIDGILERRHEQTHAVRAHLMHVVHDFREPLLIQHARDETRLDLGQHEPVAIVVVADVLVV